MKNWKKICNLYHGKKVNLPYYIKNPQKSVGMMTRAPVYANYDANWYNSMEK